MYKTAVDRPAQRESLVMVIVVSRVQLRSLRIALRLGSQLGEGIELKDTVISALRSSYISPHHPGNQPPTTSNSSTRERRRERMSASAEGDPQGCTENQVKSMLARSPVGAKLSRWVSCGKGSVAAVRRAPLSTEHRACTHARSRMRILALPPALPLALPPTANR
jgi:hypothetical protein